MSTIPFQVASSILIVDDDEVVRFLLRRFLDNLGYNVVEAVNGYEALEEVAAHNFDLVILDIAMPGIDGLGVCEQMTTSMAQSPPVLMITALDDEESVERSFKVGAVDYISKPIRWSVLKNRISSITERQQSSDLIRYMANHDSLTGLANRNYFCERLPQAISLAARYKRKLFRNCSRGTESSESALTSASSLAYV